MLLACWLILGLGARSYHLMGWMDTRDMRELMGMMGMMEMAQVEMDKWELMALRDMKGKKELMELRDMKGKKELAWAAMGKKELMELMGKRDSLELMELRDTRGMMELAQVGMDKRDSLELMGKKALMGKKVLAQVEMDMLEMRDSMEQIHNCLLGLRVLDRGLGLGSLEMVWECCFQNCCNCLEGLH